MLTPFDDYPIHQAPVPVATPASGDRNHYDRYFFNGYDRAGGFYFAAAMGIYPNRHVIDAAFSVVHEGTQRAVYASGRAPVDRGQTVVGPIRVEVVEPLRRLRVVVDAAADGIEGDVTFVARTPAVEEPRMTRHGGAQTLFDYTRLTQWGSWTGRLVAGGAEVDVDGSSTLGSRDRSWGVRPVGEPAGGAPALELPQFYWLWAPLNFDDCSTHLALNDDAEGRHWYESACRVPLLGDGPAFGVEPDHYRSADVDVEWEPGTRRAQRVTLNLRPWRGDIDEITLTPVLTFQMKGLGYLHPEWGHGRWHGETATGAESWQLDQIDPLALPNLHVQALCDAQWGSRRGVGILEQLVIGLHAPSGFTSMMDGA